MLSKISTRKLLGFYDYDINLNSDIHFITGPNGYGKTTLLSMTYSVLSRKFDVLFNAAFEQFTLVFDEGDVTFTLDISRHFEIISHEDGSDLPPEIESWLDFSLRNSLDPNDISICRINELQDMSLCENIDVFLKDKSAYFITDKRILNAVEYTEFSSEDMYDISMEKYSEDYYERNLDRAGNPDHEDRTKVLQSIVESYGFVHKSIDFSYGIRFMMDDADRTILSLDELSSGEKHIMIQAYQFLFMAKPGALVLIDEPEISFHMQWQLLFYENLKKIADYSKCRCLIATHSPEIINGHWDDSSDLFELSGEA